MKHTLTSPQQWVDQYGDYLYRYALMRLRDPHLAENAVQETLLAALKARERFGGKSTERTWLTGILKHKIIDHFRASSREVIASEIDDNNKMINSVFDDSGHFKKYPGKWEFDPNHVSDKELFWKALRMCIARLPQTTAQVFMMREIDGMDSKAVCKELGISATNLWVMLHRARLQLRTCLEQNWFEK